MKEIHLIANAHLDPVWQWRWQEGCGEVLMTFRSALDRLDEYGGLIFTCSSAAYYSWVEELDPSMFEEIRRRINEGRWVIVNGWWVQPDCNMPSGESFARHSLYSQNYYQEKFGRICRTGYNIDSFGHAGSLPQILKQGGMNSYLYMRPGSGSEPDIPDNAFVWEGTDGSRVLAFHLAAEYGLNGSDVISTELKKTSDYVDRENTGAMFLFGVGKHGGGPTRGDIEHLLLLMKSDNRLVFSDPDTYFSRLADVGSKLPHYKGELQHHARGCYSTTSVAKELNRKGENALVSAEKWDTAASIALGSKPANAQLGQAWKDLLFCQFHDSLCGCSIEEVFEDSREFIGSSLSTAHKIENSAHIRLISRIDTYVEGISAPVDLADYPREFRNHSCPYGVERPIVVFNPHPFEVSYPVQTYHPALSVRTSSGEYVPFQNVAGPSSTDIINEDTVFLAKLPPLGYETFWLNAGWNGPTDGQAEKFPTKLSAGPLFLENEYIRAEFDPETGLISSLVLKENGCEILSGNGGRPIVIDDSDSGSWGGSCSRYDRELGKMEFVDLRIRESGPFRGIIRARFRFGLSTLRIDYKICDGQKFIEMDCKAVWQENATMLKVSFPLAYKADHNTAEMPFSAQTRISDGGEEPMHRWVNAGRLSVANNCKYAYDCDGKELRITVIRNNRYAYGCPTAGRIEDDYEHTDEGLRKFRLQLIPHAETEATSDTIKYAALLNEPPVAAISGYHRGDLPRTKSFASVHSDTRSVVLSAFKKSEKDPEKLVMRLYETLGLESRAQIEADGYPGKHSLHFKPFEIKNIILEKNGKISETDFLE